MMLRKLQLTFLLLLSVMLMIPSAQAASRQEINAKVQEALSQLYKSSSSGKRLTQKAVGVLVFPEVIKAGFGIGGEYGEGALLRGGKTQGYYNLVSASLGLQFGAQMKSEVILFMTQKAMNKFLYSDGWEAGVDGSVAVATFGAGGEIDSHTAQQPIIGFIFSNKGLMYNLTIEGAKISKIDR
ncbi:BPSL1445 family SYLF domain-containing lipoprotein [Pontibacterium sinense]|nr:YSC84-related protein [Pontibacterium sinense]